MPVHNASGFLHEAIKTVLCQTLSNFEFLIIDDGSTDDSARIINSFSDNRIRFLQNETNLGITYTLNKGISEARSALIARMDADDICYPGRLETQFLFMNRNPGYAMVSAAARVITEEGTVLRVDRYQDSHMYFNLNFICWIYHSTVMYRREVVLACGGYQQDFSEDFDLWWRISRSNRIAHLQEVLLDYRETRKSLSRASQKSEYETAQHNQVLRNIYYYTGPEFKISYAEIECLRFKFGPILALNSINAITSFFKKLRHISNCILSKPNVNLDPGNLKAAYQSKMIFTLFSIIRHLSVTGMVQVLLRTGGIGFRLNYLKEVVTGIDEIETE